jgi:hypothetical protein
MKNMPLAGNRPCAFHLFNRSVTRVAPSAGKAANLPRRLVIPPGRYRVHGKVYDLKVEGLYRLIDPMRDNQQRIVYRKNPLALISALCWLQTHGNRDDKKEYNELAKQALTSKLIRTCGPACAFAKEVLRRQGIRARTVGVKTLKELNGYDDGHVLLEVLLGRKWILIDMDLNAVFVRKGKRLSLLELLPWIQRGGYQIERISGSIGLAIGAFHDGGYDYCLWAESVFHSEEGLRNWYRRIMMFPTISDETCWFFTTRSSSDCRRAKHLYPQICVNYLPWADFQERFYRGQPAKA